MVMKLRPANGASLDEVAYSGPMTFAMVEKQALLEMDELIASEPTAARILNHLIRLTEPASGGVVVISRATLAAMLRVSDPTVGRAIRTLVEGKWVQRMRIGGAYALAVNCSVAWTGPRGDIERAVFNAVVVASRAEQESDALQPTDLRRVPSKLPGGYVLPTDKASSSAPGAVPSAELVPEVGAKASADQVECA